MSSSKGLGIKARDLREILPSEVARFLFTRTDYKKAIEFDLMGTNAIPMLFDEYQKTANAYFNREGSDLGRAFEMSQIGKIKRPPSIRFSVLAQWVQMPNMAAAIKKEGLEEWSEYAKVWVERFAPESEKFSISDTLPDVANFLSSKQKQFLLDISIVLDNALDGAVFQEKIYELASQQGLTSPEAFEAIYKTLIGKTHGPKAAWLILSLDRTFVRNRFKEASQ